MPTGTCKGVLMRGPLRLFSALKVKHIVTRENNRKRKELCQVQPWALEVFESWGNKQCPGPWRARGALAYNAGLGRSPQQGPGAEPLVGGLKLKARDATVDTQEETRCLFLRCVRYVSCGRRKPLQSLRRGS